MASRLKLATQLVPLICWLSAVDSVEAKQLSFYRDSTGLHYLWQVDATPKRDLTLNVPNESALPPWQAWRSDQANAFVIQQLMTNAKEQFPDVGFNYRKTSDGSQIDYQTTDTEKYAAVGKWLPEQQDALFKSYLDQHYFKLADTPSGQAIRPDHIRIATDASEELTEIAETLKQSILSQPESTTTTGANKNEQYQVATGLLSFVQSIPYDSLSGVDENRRGLSFLMPLQVLTQNRGDCDSKATLFIALMKSLYPDLVQAMIYIPGHAFVALAIPPQDPAQQTVLIQNNPYLIFEVTGPAELPPGQAGEQSRFYVTTGHFQYDLLQPTATNSSPN